MGIRNKIKSFNSNIISNLIKETKNKELDEGKVWNSIKVAEATEALSKGLDYDMGFPYFEKKIGYKKAELVYEYSEEELKEFKKCQKDILYFAQKYCQIKTEDGKYTHFKLRDYQKKYLKLTSDNRFAVYMASRQIGKSVMTAIQILHYCCFNVEKNVLLLANKDKTVKEIVEKIKVIYVKLPMFLKPGVFKSNDSSMIFDNDCKIMSSATTADAGIGFSIDFLYADEFAHVPNNIARSFWKSIYPTLSSLNNSKCIITSTPNGFNLFYEIYNRSLQGKNSFVNMVTYWYEVKGRDEKWKREQIENLEGNEALFNQEFGCQFTTENTILLDKNTIKRLNDNSVKFEHFVIDSFEDVEDLFYDNLKWHPEHYERLMNGEFDKDGYPIFEEQRFVLGIDLAEGIGQDYSIINIFEISTMTEEEMRKIKRPKKDTDFIKLVQVGVFRSNTQKISDIARITMELVRLFGEDETLINYETNYNGDYFYKCLEDDEEFFSDLCIKTRHTQDARRPKPGIKMTRNKVNYCKDSKDLIRLNVVELTEEETVNEFKTFALNKKGSYSSQTGHDDLAMTVVGLIPGMKSDIFDEFAAEIVDTYSDDEVKLIFELIEEKTNYKEDEIYDFEDEISKSLDPFANPNKLEDKINKQLNKGSIFG
jgi:hypothetical protein